MPKFRSTKELLKYLQSTIDEVLTEDVFPVIQEAEIDTIMEVVYSQKTSGYYRRRGDAEGMGDPYNIEIQGGVAKNGILSVVNVTVPNPYLNGANERGGYASQKSICQKLSSMARDMTIGKSLRKDLSPQKQLKGCKALVSVQQL